MNKKINQENLNATMQYVEKVSENALNQLRETDPEAAKRLEQMNALFNDEDFMNKFIACDEKEDMIRLCAEHGFVMTMDELDGLLAQTKGMLQKLVDNDGKLTEEDLEQVAGGIFDTAIKVANALSSAAKVAGTICKYVPVLDQYASTLDNYASTLDKYAKYASRALSVGRCLLNLL